jgi:hypothetical protein
MIVMAVHDFHQDSSDASWGSGSGSAVNDLSWGSGSGSAVNDLSWGSGSGSAVNDLSWGSGSGLALNDISWGSGKGLRGSAVSFDSTSSTSINPVMIYAPVAAAVAVFGAAILYVRKRLTRTIKRDTINPIV